MYRSTCHILPWLGQLLSPEMVADLSEHFDVVGSVGSVSFAGVGGLERLGAVQFGSRLSIITGRLGKTRVLETLKRQADAAPHLHQLSARVAPEQSPGQLLKSVLFALLQVQPEGSALLIDDLLAAVDTATGQEVLRFLARHDKQVVMTVRLYIVDMRDM